MQPDKSLLELMLNHDLTKAFAIGVLGGVVRWLTLRHNIREGLVTILVGGICAMYLGPLALPLIEPVVDKIAPKGDPTSLSAFLIGMGGISVSGLILDIFERKRGKLEKEEKDE